MLTSFECGTLMKKSLTFALLLTVSCSLTAFAAALDNSSSSTYKLEENATETYKIKETPSIVADKKQPKIIKEDIEGGFVEKLYDTEERLIAEKMIKDDAVVQKILYYYYPDGNISRRVTAVKDSEGFLTEEYYSNGNLAAHAVFLNANNKIGQERKYDVNGVLRQEVTWVLPTAEKGSENIPQKTIRYGNIVTYYPDGTKAAVFSVSKKGQNIFYSHNGDILKEINNAEILNFEHEQMSANCEDKAVRLSLEELVELYEDEGDISYNKCGMPYRETFMYEVIDTKDGINSLVSYDQSGQIRRITPYMNGQKHGIEQKFDASGNLTAEINYQNGLKNGTATGFFPSKEKAFQKQYVNGKAEGELVCYFPTGEVAARFQYKNGLKEGSAQINSPVAQQLEFANDNLLNAPEKTTERELVSLLAGLENPDKKCLDATDKIAEIELDIEATETKLKQAFFMSEPEECIDAAKYVLENGNYVCYDAEKRKRVVYPENYALGEYAVAQVYTADGLHLYDIPYMGKKRQGWAKQYDKNGQVITEAYFNQGTLADNSRSYHPNGLVKEMFTVSDEGNRQVLASYNDEGTLLFSLSYKDGEKNQAYLSEPEKNKDVFISYYKNELDNIREVNADKPYNYIEYNLALGEYAISRENELIKGGSICINNTNETAPVISADNAPMVDDLQPIGEDELAELDRLAAEAEEHRPENALIPTETEKKQAELAAKNIGPIAKPDIADLTSAVAKTSLDAQTEKSDNAALAKTEKFYYPNGSLRKTIKTKGARTEEIKEYSKTGLLLADTVYNKDNIQIEKYYGSGQIRRKLQKAYDDNAVMAFISREDFYDNGKPRYTITRQPDVLLFAEKVYTANGLKQETQQKSPLSSLITDYDKDEKVLKTTETLGINSLVKEYDADGKVKAFSLNGKNMPLAMADKSETILRDNAKIYNKGVLKSEIKADNKQNTLIEYHPGKIIKTEIVFYNNGEISVKGYAKDGTLTKFAYLAPDGKLQIQKPVVKTIPNYRERYWVDYNNPRWVENNDKYSVKSITRLYLDTAAYILAELEWEVPEIMQKLYEAY